jgi:hypothetical protein
MNKEFVSFLLVLNGNLLTRTRFNKNNCLQPRTLYERIFMFSSICKTVGGGSEWKVHNINLTKTDQFFFLSSKKNSFKNMFAAFDTSQPLTSLISLTFNKRYSATKYLHKKQLE